ncbi:MAG: hypothetical protein FJY88_02750 [Candidatus Eisenbacteria bacterium]|nr:hypothetical protein [Candidatus Eisenbacteria bacterium]
MESLNHSARRCLTHGVGALLVFLYVGAAQAQTTGSSPSRLRIRPFFESGGFVGAETSVKYYQESTYRLHGEIGVDVTRKTAAGATGPTVGFGVTATLGRDDGRLGLGPRLTWPVHPRWALQATAGPAWSSKEESSGSTDLGWQIRTGLLYKNTVSLSVLGQTFPYREPFSGDTSKRLSSIYAGAMLHGRVGATTSVVVWGALAALIVVILTSGAAY